MEILISCLDQWTAQPGHRCQICRRRTNLLGINCFSSLFVVNLSMELSPESVKALWNKSNVLCTPSHSCVLPAVHCQSSGRDNWCSLKIKERSGRLLPHLHACDIAEPTFFYNTWIIRENHYFITSLWAWFIGSHNFYINIYSMILKSGLMIAVPLLILWLIMCFTSDLKAAIFCFALKQLQ